MKRRDLEKILHKAGYKKDRIGDHIIYEKEGCKPLQIPNHREIKDILAKKILKAAGLR